MGSPIENRSKRADVIYLTKKRVRRTSDSVGDVQSTIHEIWTRFFCSSMKDDLKDPDKTSRQAWKTRREGGFVRVS